MKLIDKYGATQRPIVEINNGPYGGFFVSTFDGRHKATVDIRRANGSMGTEIVDVEDLLIDGAVGVSP